METISALVARIGREIACLAAQARAIMQSSGSQLVGLVTLTPRVQLSFTDLVPAVGTHGEECLGQNDHVLPWDLVLLEHASQEDLRLA